MKTQDWIQQNYQLLRKTTEQIIKNPNDIDDFYHFILEQVLNKKSKLDKITDKEKMYWFVRVVKNNYFSNSSPWYYQFKRAEYRATEYDEERYEDIPDEDYEETIPDMEWVKLQLNTLDWFSRDLFLYWIEMGTLTKLSQETKIPINSVGKYIKQIKQILKERYETETNRGGGKDY